MRSRLIAPVRWFGGKGSLASWIYSFFPDPTTYKVYCEPFGGAASLLFFKPPFNHVEVYNDLDGNIVSLFRVLQDEKKSRLFYRKIKYTMYSLAEFSRSLDILNNKSWKNDVERAWAVYVKYNQGFSGTGRSSGNWSRTFISRKGMASVCSRWITRLKMIPLWTERLRRVQIDQRDAIEVILYWDSPDTLFYLDPPYVESTRTKTGRFEVEMTEEQHERLVEVLSGVKAQVVLSGYDHPIYDSLVRLGWEKRERRVGCSASGGGRIRGSSILGFSRKEVVWYKKNPRVNPGVLFS